MSIDQSKIAGKDVSSGGGNPKKKKGCSGKSLTSENLDQGRTQRTTKAEGRRDGKKSAQRNKTLPVGKRRVESHATPPMTKVQFGESDKNTELGSGDPCTAGAKSCTVQPAH